MFCFCSRAVVANSDSDKAKVVSAMAASHVSIVCSTHSV
jgi:hypothetical protein